MTFSGPNGQAGTLTLTADRNITIDQPIGEGGVAALTLQAPNGTITVNAPISLADDVLTRSAGFVETANGSINVNPAGVAQASKIGITADSVTLDGAAGSISGARILEISPLSTNVGITLGGSGGSGVQLSQDALNTFNQGGEYDTTSNLLVDLGPATTITVAGAATLPANTMLAGGTIAINGPFSVAVDEYGNPKLDIEANTAVTLNDAIVLPRPVTISAPSFTQTANGSINLGDGTFGVGDLVINTDQLALNGAAGSIGYTNSITIAPLTDGLAVTVGGDGSGGGLQVSQAELNVVTDMSGIFSQGAVTIGDMDSDLTIAGSVTLPEYTTFIGQNVTIAAADVALSTSQSVGLGDGPGQFQVTQAVVDGFSGLQALSVTTTDTMTLDGALTFPSTAINVAFTAGSFVQLPNGRLVLAPDQPVIANANTPHAVTILEDSDLSITANAFSFQGAAGSIAPASGDAANVTLTVASSADGTTPSVGVGDASGDIQLSQAAINVFSGFIGDLEDVQPIFSQPPGVPGFTLSSPGDITLGTVTLPTNEQVIADNLTIAANAAVTLHNYYETDERYNGNEGVYYNLLAANTLTQEPGSTVTNTYASQKGGDNAGLIMGANYFSLMGGPDSIVSNTIDFEANSPNESFYLGTATAPYPDNLYTTPIIAEELADSAIALVGVGGHGLGDHGMQVAVRFGLALQELRQEGAGGIDVVGRRSGQPGLTSRAAIARREGRARLVGDVVEQSSDAEVEQLHAKALLHHDVARLDVGMDDQVAVGVLDGAGRLAEEREAGGEVGLDARTVSGDRVAEDQLHDEVGRPVLRHAAVEELADVRVAQSRQDAPFGGEARHRPLRAERLAHQLDGHPLLEKAVVAFA